MIVEMKPGDPLSLDLERLNDSIELSLADCTVVADSLDVQETSVGLEADLPQSGQVVQSLAEVEVTSVVDGRLRPQRTAFLIVLLDPIFQTVVVQRGDYSLSDQSGQETPRSLGRDYLVKDQLDLIRTTKIQVLGDHLFKEDEALRRLVMTVPK